MLKKYAIYFMSASLICNLPQLFAEKSLHLTKESTFLTIDKPIHITDLKTFDETTSPNVIIFIEDGALIVESNATLKLKDIVIIGVHDTNICCTDQTGKVILQNVTIVINKDFSWNTGNIELQGGLFSVFGNGYVYLNKGTINITENVQVNASCNCMYIDKVTLTKKPETRLTTSTYETIQYLSDKQQIFKKPHTIDIAVVEKSWWQSILSIIGF